MGENTENMEVITEGDVTENAELMAAADSASGGEDESSGARIPYIVKLSRAYDFDGKSIDAVDLTGLEDLTTMDAQEVDQIVNRLGHTPSRKWKDTLYTKHVAVKASGLPVEFFNRLKWKDMENITSVVALHFLFG